MPSSPRTPRFLFFFSRMPLPGPSHVPEVALAAGSSHGGREGGREVRESPRQSGGGGAGSRPRFLPRPSFASLLPSLSQHPPPPPPHSPALSPLSFRKSKRVALKQSKLHKIKKARSGSLISHLSSQKFGKAGTGRTGERNGERARCFGALSLLPHTPRRSQWRQGTAQERDKEVPRAPAPLISLRGELRANQKKRTAGRTGGWGNFLKRGAANSGRRAQTQAGEKGGDGELKKKKRHARTLVHTPKVRKNSRARAHRPRARGKALEEGREKGREREGHTHAAHSTLTAPQQHRSS